MLIMNSFTRGIMLTCGAGSWKIVMIFNVSGRTVGALHSAAADCSQLRHVKSGHIIKYMREESIKHYIYCKFI